MKKSKAITLLTIIGVLLVALVTMTFLRFTAGITDYNSILGAINLDYDIKGGYAYELTLADDNAVYADDDEVLDTLAERLDYLGYKGYTIKAVKNADTGASSEEINSSFVITVPAKIGNYGSDDTTALTSDIAAVARYGVVKIYGGTQNDTTTEIAFEGNVVESAKYAGSQYDGQSTVYTVSLKFTETCYDAILSAESAATEAFYLKLTLGDVTLINGEFSSEGIADRTIYVPNSDETTAKQTALQLSMGGLEYKFNEFDSDFFPVNVTPLLGKNTAVLTAIVIGAAALLAIAGIIVVLRGYGIVSAISVIAFLFTLTAMLVAVPGLVLSMPGVFGILASLVFTVASLFATGKRINEEYSKGKTVKSAVKAGYNGVFKTILNALVVIVIASLSIFLFTSGTIQCFGITLGIGSAVSFIATALLSRLLTSCFIPLCKNPEGFFNLKREDA